MIDLSITLFNSKLVMGISKRDQSFPVKIAFLLRRILKSQYLLIVSVIVFDIVHIFLFDFLLILV